MLIMENINQKIKRIFESDCQYDKEMAENHVSEHTKINEITDMVHEIHPDAIFTIDRAGDSGTIMNPCD